MNANVVSPATNESATPVADAQRWLALIDAGDCAASWTASGSQFQRHVTQEAWASAVGATREPLGALVSRTLSKEERSTSLPGAPDGDYDVIQFLTAFAYKKAALETVVMAHEPAGWRPVGYFVK